MEREDMNVEKYRRKSDLLKKEKKWESREKLKIKNRTNVNKGNALKQENKER